MRGQSARLKSLVGRWMEGRGPGFSDFGKYLNYKSYEEALRQATYSMVEGRQHSLTEPLEFLFTGISDQFVPVYLCHNNSALTALKPFPKSGGVQIKVHTKEHPPPHVHVYMPPGHPLGGYSWDQFHPVHDAAPLSSRQRRSIDKYLKKHKGKINAKIKEVYPATSGSTNEAVDQAE